MNAVATIERIESRELAAPAPAELLRLAIEQKADPTYMRELMQLQREWEANQARKAYVAAMAKFKDEPIEIVKDKQVSYGTTNYSHATIGNVTQVIGSRLAKYGFSHRWDTDQGDGKISVTCVITHELGHYESTKLTASPDTSGAKNAIQSIASTVSYLQRYTLLAATGMATKDQEDDDGQGSEQPQAPHLKPEFADWRAKVDSCITPEDFAATWKEMTPAIRAVMAPYVKQKKAEKVSA